MPELIDWITIDGNALSALAPTGANRSIGVDASVAVAHEGGDRRERAMHWAGLSEGVVIERPRFRAVRPTTSLIPGPYA